MSLRDRLDLLSRGEIAGLIVVLLVLLGGAGLWYTRSLPKPVTIAASTGPGAAEPSLSPTPSPVPLIVDVAGAVHRPGVYDFVDGARVVDAIQRAGGALPKADLTLLNLAAPLTDGIQILVPKQGAMGTGSSSGSVAGSTGTLININTASAEQLDELPGIGEVLAATIVAYRTENGPFTSVDQLDDVSGIGPATLEDLRDLVTI